MQKRLYVITGLTVATIGALAVTGIAAAQDQSGGFGRMLVGPLGGEDGLAAKIASVFNLDQTAVAETISQYREEQVGAGVDKQVKAGRLTEEQATALKEKMAAQHAKLAEIAKIEDESARQAALQQLHAEMRSWAQDNNIPMPGHERHHGGRQAGDVMMSEGGMMGPGGGMMGDDDGGMMDGESTAAEQS